MKTKKILVMLCVNDPDNGCDTGRVSAIEFSAQADSVNPMIKLESSYWNWGPVCRLLEGDPKRIKISRRTFPILGYRTWVGNWCWDAALVTIETANQILAYLKSQHDRKGNPYWSPDQAWTEIWEAWEKGEKIDLAKFIEKESTGA